MKDKLTITLFSKETNDPPGFKKDFLNEVENIKKIRNGFIKAAKEANRHPPEIVVSLLLVPDWDKPNNSYSNREYLTRKNAFLSEAKDKLQPIDGVRVEDFYFENNLTIAERIYMYELKALGSNADIMKTRAIINNLHSHQHLQIDSNTIVPSYKELYEHTFNAREQKDGINASYYDATYITAHNKMVYTTPTGAIAQNGKLEITLWEYCDKHKNDNNVDEDKRPPKNSIYAKVFTEALHLVDYVGKYTLSDGKILYPATLNEKVYWLTDYMTTAINMSWSAEGIEIPKSLKALPAIPFGEDSSFNFQCFFNVIKKHTGNLENHSKMLNLNDTSDTGEESRKLLLNLSNNQLELAAVKQFYNNVLSNHPLQAKELSMTFPKSTLGDTLSVLLFKCTVEDLLKNAEIITNNALQESTQIANAQNRLKM